MSSDAVRPDFYRKKSDGTHAAGRAGGGPAYQVFTIVTRHRNPLRDELYTHLRPYREVRDANLPVETPASLPQSSAGTGRLVAV